MTDAAASLLQPAAEKGVTGDFEFLTDDRIKNALSYMAYTAKTINLPGSSFLRLASNTADLSSLVAKNSSVTRKVLEVGLSQVVDVGVDVATEVMMEEAGIVAAEVFIGLNPEIWPIIAAGAILKLAGSTLVEAAAGVDEKGPEIASEAQQEIDRSSGFQDGVVGESASFSRIDAEQD